MFSPEGSSFAALSSVPVFSSAVLDASTMGDPALQREVVQLFRSQFGSPVDIFGPVTDGSEWKFAAHALRGTAAALGALEVASLATLMEEGGLPPDSQQRESSIKMLSGAVARFLEAVDRFTSPVRASA